MSNSQIPGAPSLEDTMLAAVAVVRAITELGPVLASDPALCLLLAQLASMTGGALLAVTCDEGGEQAYEHLLERLDDLEQSVLSWVRGTRSGEEI